MADESRFPNLSRSQVIATTFLVCMALCGGGLTLFLSDSDDKKPTPSFGNRPREQSHLSERIRLALRLPEPGPVNIAFLVGTLSLIGGGMLVWGAMAARAPARNREERAREFEKLCLRKRLTRSDVYTITSLAKHSRVTDPLELVSSPEQFGKAVETHLAGGDGGAVDRPLKPIEIQRRAERASQIRSIRRKLGLKSTRAGSPFRSTLELTPDQEVRIAFQVGESTSGRVSRYLATVVAVNDLQFILSWPRDSSGSPVDCLLGQPVELFTWRVGDAGYLLRTCIREAREYPLSQLVLEHTTDIEKVQRREYIRVPVDLPFEFAVIRQSGGEEDDWGSASHAVARATAKDDGDSNDDSQLGKSSVKHRARRAKAQRRALAESSVDGPGSSSGDLDIDDAEDLVNYQDYVGRLVDISGAGLAFASLAELDKGDEIRGMVPKAPDPVLTRLDGTVVGRSLREGEQVYHVEFRGIAAARIDQIVKYTFRVRREQLRTLAKME